MAIVSVAIIVNFHLKSEPSTTGKIPEKARLKASMSDDNRLLTDKNDLERRVSFPVGVIFWMLSVACLVSGLANYIKTISRYSRRTALVQAGWKTQTVFTVVATTIVAACILFLTTNAQTRR